MDILRAALLGVIGLGLLTKQFDVPLPLLFLIAVLLESAQIIFFAASQRAVGHIVEPQNFEEANSQFSTLTILTEVVGPQLGAILVAAPAIPLLGDAASFAASAALLTGLPPIPPAPDGRSLRSEVALGWHWFRRSRHLLLLTGIMSAGALAMSGVIATEIPLIIDTFKLDNWVVGAYTVCMALGGAARSALAPPFIKYFGPAITPFGMFLSGITRFACVNQRSVFVLFIAMFFQQFVIMVTVVATFSLRMRMIPPDLRGRIIALSRSAAFAAQIVGALFGGWVAKAYGTDEVFAYAGVLIVLVALLTAPSIERWPNRSLLDGQVQYSTAGDAGWILVAMPVGSPIN